MIGCGGSFNKPDCAVLSIRRAAAALSIAHKALAAASTQRTSAQKFTRLRRSNRTCDEVSALTFQWLSLSLMRERLRQRWLRVCAGYAPGRSSGAYPLMTSAIRGSAATAAAIKAFLQHASVSTQDDCKSSIMRDRIARLELTRGLQSPSSGNCAVSPSSQP